MPTLVSINGALHTEKTARVPVFDRGFLFGDSVFEVLRTYGGRLFAFDLHLDRLDRSARAISLDLPFTRAAMLREIRRTVARAGNRESYIRIVVTRGRGKIGMDPCHARSPQAVVIVTGFTPPPRSLDRRGTAAQLVALRRNSKDALAPSIKSGNYLNSVLAHIEARRSGADEAVMLNPRGFVAEGTTFNVFMVSRGVVLTPPVSAGILDGITRRVLIDHGRKAGIDVRESNFRGERMLRADEVAFTSTLREVQPVLQISGRRIGSGKPGPVTRRLHEVFTAAVGSYLI